MSAGRPAPVDGAEPVVVVGGVGGSGTRVVAEVLRSVGIHMGSDCNRAGDNWWFTLLGKLPRWDPRLAPAPGDPVLGALAVLERATVEGRLGRADQRTVAAVVERCSRWWHLDPLPDDRPPSWLAARAGTLCGGGARDRVRGRWGFKEPNTHLFLDHLHHHFGGRLRYVHVVRHGVHMAHSRNQAQVRRWGWRFGVPVGARQPTPVESLDYWIRANEAALERGAELPAGRFLSLSYDALCAEPRPALARLLAFVGVDVPAGALDELAALPRSPAPRGESGEEAEAVYGTERLARVRALGFPA